MRAGELRHRAAVLELDAGLCPVELGRAWLGIHSKESADAPMQAGLRSRTPVEIRARYSSLLQVGRYIIHDARLLHITSVRDPVGTRAELRITADEFTGAAADYHPAEGPHKCCRVYLAHEAPWLDERGVVTDYKTRAEVALIEVGRPQVGDRLTVGGTTYTIVGYADETDDGVVRGLWLERY